MDLERTRRLGEKHEAGDDVGDLFRDDETELDANDQRLMASVESKLFDREPPVDVMLDRYVLEGRVGSGGMGVVFKARDPALGRAVAIKFLNADGGASGDTSAGQRRLLREARLIARVNHPNVVNIHDVRPYDSLPDNVARAAGMRGVSTRGVFLVMELVDGEPLREWQSRPDITREQVLDAYVAAGRGLAAVHAAGLVHRDFKPSNVLVGNDGRVRVLDFGLARSSTPALPPSATPDPSDDSQQIDPPSGEATITEAGHVVGTPRYMAPEQFRGDAITPRTDVFAFSLSLFEALTGRFPFPDGSPHELAAAKRAGRIREVPTDASVAPWCFAILRRGLAPKPDDRFAGVAEMVEEIERQRRPRSRAWVAPLALAGVALVGVSVVVYGAVSPPEPVPVFTQPAPKGDPGLVAVLPFEVASDDARLGTARDTLPFILVEGMGAHGKLRTVDYFVVRRDVEPPGAGPAEIAKWREASIAAGAGVLIGGRLSSEGSTLRLHLTLETADGEPLGEIERSTTFADLPATLRTVATEAASRVLGAAVDPPASHAYAWDYDTLLADGARLLEHGEFADAIARLEAATAIVPEAPDAWFYLAVALSWSEAPGERAFAAIDHALEAGLDGARKSFLLGFREYINRNYDAAAEIYREALARDPGDPYLTYGLFEALYHGGRPRDAMAVVQGLGGKAPAIHQSLMHVLDYHAAQGNAEGLRRALALAKTVDAGVAESWETQVRIFEGDYAGALEQLGALDPKRHSTDALLVTRMEVLTLSGEVDLALALAEPMARVADPNVMPILGLQAARGADEERRRYLAIGLSELQGQRHEQRRARSLSDLVVVTVPVADHEELRQLAALSTFDPHASLSAQISRIMLADGLHETDVLAAADASPFPEVRALAKASTAEAAGKLDEAANELSVAIESSLDGRFITVERWRLARVQHAAGDLDGAAATCKQVIRPPRFHWSWGATVGPCLAWTIEAGNETRANEARELQRRLRSTSNEPE